MSKRIFIVIAVMTACFNSWAQHADLDPVTVTTSITPENTSRTGRNLVVFKGERFNTLPVHSIDELLRYIPGIELQARGPFGSQSDITIRGGTFQQVLVILDGVRLNDPNTGHFSTYIPVAPAEIDRIEVLKGASSAVYGSEAVGGVVHIITKAFTKIKQLTEGRGVVQLKGGEYELLSLHAGGVIHKPHAVISGGILTNHTTGQQQRGIRGFVRAHTASLAYAHQVSQKLQFSIRSAYDDRDFAAQNFYTTFISDTSTERVKTIWNQMQMHYLDRDHVLRFSAGYKVLNDRFSFNSVATPNLNDSKLLQALITDEWTLQNTSVITTGFQFINKNIRSNDRGNHDIKQSAVFMILNQKLSDQLSVAPAIRLEWNERAGWEWVPQVNASYRTGDFQLRGSAGKTIRDADFTERFNNYNKTFVASGRIGNPDLQSERSFSYEAGADYFLNQNLRFSISYFARNHRKLIDYVQTPYSEMPRQSNLSPTGTYALAKNISRLTTNGFETDIILTKKISESREIWGTAGFLWLHSKNEGTPSFYISSHARFLTNFNLQYSSKMFLIALNGIYKNRQAQSAASPVIAAVSKDYFVMNGKAEVYTLQRKLAAFIEADNMFNTSYADILGSQMPGRWLMGGIKITLSK